MLLPDFKELVTLKDGKRAPIASQKNVKTQVSGNHASPFRGQGLEFDSVREYVPGDDIRNIDWRVTARTGSPHLKVFREEKERNVLICTDVNSSMRFGTRKTFKSVQVARVSALLGWTALAAQDRVSGCLFGDVVGGIQYFPPKRSSLSFSSLLKTLSKLPEEKHEVPLIKALQYVNPYIKSGSLVYIISDFMDVNWTELKPLINKMRQRSGLVFVSVNDPADRMIPSVGFIQFQRESQKVLADTNNKKGQEVYEAFWTENRRELKEFTKKLRISLIELSTESDLLRGMR